VIEENSFEMKPDQKLGVAIREALAPHHDGAFLTRMRARLAQRAGSWDEELAHWFWRGLAAATAATVLAGLGLSRMPATSVSVEQQADEPSIASDLLLGDQPGTDVILVSMRSTP
jgi:hypothetical protein